MSNILITGANGQLGRELSKLIPDAVLTDIDELDITDFKCVMDFVKEHDIKTIINCAAYTAVDKAEDEPEVAYKINVLGPKNLASTGCELIHISTDYVFEGKNFKPYGVSDQTNPISVYGQTKLEGEIEVLKSNLNTIIIRTAWLYSVNGSNFVKTMRKLGNERTSLQVVFDQIGSPTYAGDLAKAIVEILPQIKNNGGIYHYTNEGVCSWYDFAKKIMELSNINCEVHPILSSDYPTKAQRPFYSVLDKTDIKTTFNIEIPHWEDGLIRCLKEFNDKEGVSL